jgi:hypothetical protein
MIPMALGLGEGGEQNAPLGRAVIGGLLCATGATLVFVPSVFSLLHSRRSGADPYLQVLTAQTIALQNERNDVNILRRRMDASVLLIKALGEGWPVSERPKTVDLH